MGVLSSAKRLDDAVLGPARLPTYDVTPPWWFTVGGLLGSCTGVPLLPILLHTSGLLRVGLLAALGLVIVFFLLTVWRWHRTHLVQAAPQLSRKRRVTLIVVGVVVGVYVLGEWLVSA